MLLDIIVKCTIYYVNNQNRSLSSGTLWDEHHLTGTQPTMLELHIINMQIQIVRNQPFDSPFQNLMHSA